MALDWLARTSSGKMVQEMAEEKDEKEECKPNYEKEENSLATVEGEDHVTQLNKAFGRVHHVTFIYFWIQLTDLCLHFKTGSSSSPSPSPSPSPFPSPSPSPSPSPLLLFPHCRIRKKKF